MTTANFHVTLVLTVAFRMYSVTFYLDKYRELDTKLNFNLKSCEIGKKNCKSNQLTN